MTKSKTLQQKLDELDQLVAWFEGDDIQIEQALKKFDEAETVCHELTKRYPDQVDGIERLAMVYEARGEKEKAVEYYLKTVEFMRSNPGFDEVSIKWTLDKANKLKA